MYLLPANEEIRDLLTRTLDEYAIAFEPESNLLALPGSLDRSRVVALLRQVLSGPERDAVRIVETDGSRFPNPRSLDDWWRVDETSWFSEALSNDRFETWFQPIFDTEKNMTFAHESLIRLRSGRIYSGAEIVDAAVVRNELHLFDSYARRLAIRSAARQSRDGIYFVNFMPSAIYNPRYCMKSTMEALAESGMNPGNIVLEVVESDSVPDSAHLRAICDYYRSEGFRFALDDVGMGSSSLRMICDLRPDFIKLDKSLITQMEQPMYAATIRKLVELADQFGIGVIGEGVETARTMENLWLLGVKCMQGYFFGRPAPQVGQVQDLSALEFALGSPAVDSIALPVLC